MTGRHDPADLAAAANLLQPNAAHALLAKAAEHDDHQLATAIVRRARELLRYSPHSHSWAQVIDDARKAGFDTRVAA